MRKILFLRVLLLTILVVPIDLVAKKKTEEELIITYKHRVLEKKKVSKRKYQKIEQPSDSTGITRCNFKVADFEDIRQNKATIGAGLTKPIIARGINDWLAAALEDLLIKKIRNQNDNLMTLELLPKLTRLYTYNSNINIHGVTAIRVDILENSKIIGTRRYRGFASNPNWNNGDDEFLDAADLSISIALPKLVRDLKSICGSAISRNDL